MCSSWTLYRVNITVRIDKSSRESFQALTEYIDLIEELYMVAMSYIFGEDPNTESFHNSLGIWQRRNLFLTNTLIVYKCRYEEMDINNLSIPYKTQNKSPKKEPCYRFPAKSSVLGMRVLCRWNTFYHNYEYLSWRKNQHSLSSVLNYDSELE